MSGEAKIKELLVELHKNDSIIREGEEYLALVAEDQMKEIEKLEAEKDSIDKKISEIRAMLKEEHADNTQAVEEAENAKAGLLKKIKALCHKLPVDRLAKRGMKFYDDDDKRNVTISVSKAQTARI